MTGAVSPPFFFLHRSNSAYCNVSNLSTHPTPHCGIVHFETVTACAKILLEPGLRYRLEMANPYSEDWTLNRVSKLSGMKTRMTYWTHDVSVAYCFAWLNGCFRLFIFHTIWPCVVPHDDRLQLPRAIHRMLHYIISFSEAVDYYANFTFRIFVLREILFHLFIFSY